MIVCSCNVITDHDVRAAVSAAQETPRTAKQVYGCLGCSAECGRCARTIKQIMTEALTGAAAVALTDALTSDALTSDALADETSTTGCCACGRADHAAHDLVDAPDAVVAVIGPDPRATLVA